MNESNGPLTVLIADPIAEPALAWLREKGARTLRPQHLRDFEASAIDALIVSSTRVESETLDRFPNLRVVGKFGAGVDTIDLAAASERRLSVTHTPGENANAVAELGIAMLLASARDTREGDSLVREGRFGERQTTRMKLELFQKRIGVVGAGRVGAKLAKICRGGFECEVGIYDPHLRPEARTEHMDTVFTSVFELCHWADHLFIAAPLTAETRSLVRRDELLALGPRGVVVICSRGGIVDENDLADILNDGGIFAAGVDAFASEPPHATSPIVTASNVLLSPHAGGYTERAQNAMAMAICKHVWNLLNGQEAPLVGKFF